jgi:hypothetical protein
LILERVDQKADSRERVIVVRAKHGSLQKITLNDFEAKEVSNITLAPEDHQLPTKTKSLHERLTGEAPRPSN